MQEIKIVWTLQAKASLRDIYKFYKAKSPQGALNVKNDLLHSPKTIRYARQYQVDDINPKYRRIVVRHYKVLYREESNTINIIDIVSTLQSPDKLEML